MKFKYISPNLLFAAVGADTEGDPDDKEGPPSGGAASSITAWVLDATTGRVVVSHVHKVGLVVGTVRVLLVGTVRVRWQEMHIHPPHIRNSTHYHLFSLPLPFVSLSLASVSLSHTHTHSPPSPATHRVRRALYMLSFVSTGWPITTYEYKGIAIN